MGPSYSLFLAATAGRIGLQQGFLDGAFFIVLTQGLGELLLRVTFFHRPLSFQTFLSLLVSSGPWPKKEDWLKKMERKQRRPGCRRKKT